MESCFVKYSDSNNGFENVYIDLTSNGNFKLKLHYTEHKGQFMTDTYYILMVMQKYLYVTNQKKNEKQNKIKKKLRHMT